MNFHPLEREKNGHLRAGKWKTLKPHLLTVALAVLLNPPERCSLIEINTFLIMLIEIL
jgi:hypothetical protein